MTILIAPRPTGKAADLLLTVERDDAPDCYDLVCFCPKSRRRKDGSCRPSDAALALVKPEHRDKVRVVHP